MGNRFLRSICARRPRPLEKRISLHLVMDQDGIKIDHRQAIAVFGPGNANCYFLFFGNQFGISRGRLPFIEQTRFKSTCIEKAANCGDYVLVNAVPICSEIFATEKLLKFLD